MENPINNTANAVGLKSHSRKTTLMQVAEYILFGLIFLLPFFFIPSISFPFQFGKVMLLALGILVAFVLWMVDTLSRGKIRLPLGIVFYSALAILLFALVSSLLSGVAWRAVIGLGFESETFVSLLIFFISMFVALRVLDERSKVLKAYNLLSISALIVFLFQFLRIIFGPSFLSFGIFTNMTASILGKWNDIGIFFGLMALLSVLRLMYVKKSSPWLSQVMFGLSLIALIVVNSLLVWLVTGIFALLVLVYDAVFTKRDEEGSEFPAKGKFSKLPIILIVFALVFIFARGSVGNFISDKLNVNQIEVRPSWQSTLEVGADALKKNPAFGVGPNQFSPLWNNEKPRDVNLTPFWNVDFNFGIGFIPTTLSTQGILGFVSWILLLVGIILLGLRALLAAGQFGGANRFIIMATLLSTLFLWTFMVFYLPGMVMITLAFIMTGLFLSVMSSFSLISQKEYTFGKDSIAGFASILGIVAIVLLSVLLLYGVGARYISGVSFQKSLIALNVNADIESGEKYAREALSFAKTDRNYRLVSNIEILKLNQLVSNTTDVASEETRTEFQNLLGSAIRNAQLATQKDSTNYQNWLALGSIYESIIPLGINGAYESAISTYGRAEEANPTNPQIDLIMARTELANNNATAAREHIAQSLTKKANYTAAIFLLSQIEIQEGNIAEAIQSVESATLNDPNDPVLFFQLGFLRYSQGQFERAVESLERAVALSPPYSNAKYFLGLSYYNLGRSIEAIAQFEDLIISNPENQEVKVILQNMKDGETNPLQGLQGVDPEEREDLPVEEEN